jgi:hypothetical protein
MPDGEKRKVRNSSVKTKTEKKTSDGESIYTDSTERKIKMTHHKKVDKEGKATAAKKRHDLMMRSTGRKKVATNYGTKKGDKKRD